MRHAIRGDVLMNRWLKGLVFAGALSAVASASAAQSRFEGWSSTVIAADWRDGEGLPIEAFDNARRDLSVAIQKAGFPSAGHLSITLNPAKPDTTAPGDALRQIGLAATQASSGCLFYLTSHGEPQRLVFGNTKGIEPVDLANMLRQWCGQKPTVVVLSACFSGSFVDALRAPNRMILTAARRDRTSFGCGAEDTYPWFDACVLEAFPQSADFLDLARLSRACVTRRENDAGIETPSEPQLFVGAEMQMRLPTLRFQSP